MPEGLPGAIISALAQDVPWLDDSHAVGDVVQATEAVLAAFPLPRAPEFNSSQSDPMECVYA